MHVYLALVCAFVPALASNGQEAETPDPALASLRAQALALEPLLATKAARDLLALVPLLPAVETRTVWRARTGGYLAEAWTASEHAALSADQRAACDPLQVDTRRWYETFYGTPLAALHAWDIAASAADFASFRGKRVLDFGFGSIGQLELLARAGADVVGVEVMPALRAIYADVAAPTRLEGSEGRAGSRHLLFGRWPAEADLRTAVGDGFDLILAKNTIKRGFLAPPLEIDARFQVDLGVPHDVFLERLHDALAPGGFVLFYNLGGAPAPTGEPYRPSTDIASPWDRGTYAGHGFDVLALDANDDEAARELGFALGWEASMELETGLYASYTLLQRPKAPR